MFDSATRRGVLTVCTVFLAVVIGSFFTASRIWHTELPAFNECFQGREMALIDIPAPPGAAYFLNEDEASYLRSANQIARGETATDFNGALISAAASAPFDTGRAQRFPLYRVAYLLGKDAPPDTPFFVSYRSVVFPSLGAPVLKITGCNTLGLTYLRYGMVMFRALLIVAAGLLAYSVASQFKLTACAIASMLVACDAQLNEAGAFFMADVPGVALFLFALAGLIRLSRVGGTLMALSIGVLAAIAVLIKFDFLYVFPLVLLVSILLVPKPERRTYLRHATLVFAAYLVVLGTYMQRNHALTGTWFITSKDTVNLYIGNSIDAPARHFRYGMSDTDNGTLVRIPLENAKELRENGPEIAMRSFFKARVLEIFTNEPKRVMTMFTEKFWIFLNSGDFVHYPLLGKFSHVVSAFIMLFAALVSPFFLVISKRREWTGAIVPVSFLALLTMVSLVFFEPRFMTHLFPLATIVSTVSILGLLGHLKKTIAGFKVPA